VITLYRPIEPSMWVGFKFFDFSLPYKSSSSPPHPQYLKLKKKWMFVEIVTSGNLKRTIFDPFSILKIYFVYVQKSLTPKKIYCSKLCEIFSFTRGSLESVPVIKIFNVIVFHCSIKIQEYLLDCVFAKSQM
jgi:hypothetical protein